MFACVPLLTCAMVATVLHGTAFTHFHSMYKELLYLEGRSYQCSDIALYTTRCQCTPVGSSANVVLSVPCREQKYLVGLHGALLTFSAIAFALQFVVFAIGILFMLKCYKLQVTLLIIYGGCLS